MANVNEMYNMCIDLKVDKLPLSSENWGKYVCKYVKYIIVIFKLIYIVYSINIRQTKYVICLKIMTIGRNLGKLQDAVISFI